MNVITFLFYNNGIIAIYLFCLIFLFNKKTVGMWPMETQGERSGENCFSYCNIYHRKIQFLSVSALNIVQP